ncbi:MAG: hypothetical protein J6S40_03615, partial [Thermoguttaceae bacterium]|nr:hypothetical protein [Thermoguttaceae bacterium]
LIFLIAAAVLAPFFGAFVVLLSVLAEKLTGWHTPVFIAIELALFIALLIYSLIRDKVLSRQKTLNIVLIAVGILCPFHDGLRTVVPSAVYRPIHWTACIIACIAVLAFFVLNESELKKLSRVTLLLLLSWNILGIPFIPCRTITERILDVCLPFIS